MPGFLNAAIVRATPRGLRARPSPEAFCLIEQACHLRDLEREGYAVRLRRMLEQSAPALTEFEGDVIARERNYMVQDPRDAAAEFAIARGDFVARAELLSEAQWARTGTFGGNTITIRDLVSMMVEHDEGHRAEIAALAQWR
jgi:hypothetical protein